MDVSAGDRALFAKRNVPKPGGDAVQMKEWVRAVRGSMKRREKIEQLDQRDLRTYLGACEMMPRGECATERWSGNGRRN